MDRRKGVLKLKAETRIAVSRIVPMISVIYNSESVRREISDVRSMATDAMGEIVQMQEATSGPGKRSALKQRYNDAVNGLITADQLEKGRYFALRGESQQAVDAYTKGLETSPGLAIAIETVEGFICISMNVARLWPTSSMHTPAMPSTIPYRETSKRA